MVSRQTRLVLLSVLMIPSLEVPAAPCPQAANPSGASQGARLLTLDDAERLALEHNQALRAQRMNIEQAKANEVHPRTRWKETKARPGC
jgi:outer membrane protein TolC